MQEYAHEDLAATLRRGQPLVWGDPDDGAVHAGWGHAARFDAWGPDRFEELSQQFDTYAAAHATGPDTRAYATVTFAANSAAPSTLVVPAVRGVWRDGVLAVEPNVAGAPGIPDPAPARPPEEPEFHAGRLTREGFRRAVARAVALIDAGEADKIVLARDLVAAGALDLAGLLVRLRDANPGAWVFQVDGMVGASPEMLVALRDGAVFSRVLAGSAPVTGDTGADDAAAAALMASGKDHVEHEYAARSVSARLARLGSVHAVGPQVLRLNTIMHLATEINGTLSQPLSALQVAGAVHPSAAVCGTPTRRAAELIQELEAMDRGRYAGPVGWMDARGNGQFALALRCGQVEGPDSIRLFAGGGIVTGSDPTAELAETARKFLPMYQALSQVAQP